MNAADTPTESATPGLTGVGRILGRLAGLNVLNLALGLVLNVVLAAKLGATGAKDAVDAAIAIPVNLVQTFGVASLGGATLYVVGRMGDARGGRLDGYLTATLVVQSAFGLAALVALWAFQDPLVAYFAGDVAPVHRAVLRTALAWTAWTVVLRPLVTLLGSAAVGMHRYGAVQAGTFFEKLGTVGGALLIGVAGASAYPAGLTVGLGAGVLVLGVYLARLGVRPAWPRPFWSAEMREGLRLSLPWIATSPFLNASAWVLIPLMLRLPPGSYAAWGYAVLLNQMLMAVFLGPVTDWLSPVLARAAGAAASGDRAAVDDEWRTVALGFRVSLLSGAALLVLSVGLAKPMVGLLFFRGAMTEAAAVQIAQLTAVLGVGMVGRAVVTYCARLFQARVAMKKYVLIQLAEPLVSLPVALLLADRVGVMAVALGTTAFAWVGAGIGMALGLRGGGGLGLGRRRVAWFAAAAGLAVVAWALPLPMRPGLFYNVGVGAGVGVGLGAAVAGLGFALKVPEVEWLWVRAAAILPFRR